VRAVSTRLSAFIDAHRDHDERSTSYAVPLCAIAPVDAEIALLQLATVELQVERMRANALRWDRLLSASPFATVRRAPLEDSTCLKWWMVDDSPVAGALLSSLAACGVEVEPLYEALHLRAPFDTFRRTPLPVTESLSRRVFSLPTRQNLDPHDWARIERACGHAPRS
jgi:dTDP-4-amino-4,6-dideoxygalactose transaminase